MKSESTELPDCIISHIFSMLTLKDLVKTSALSKQWFHEWGLRKDLNFDLHNMFDYNTITLPLLQQTQSQFVKTQSQFATRLDNFMHKYHGDMIRSIRVNFPLGLDHTYAIDGLIHKGVLKGANRIELLFDISAPTEPPHSFTKPYKFLFPFLSGTNSVTYLHLQNCHIASSMKFSGLKNLKTLVLHLVPVEQNMLQDLCFSCIHLENLTLYECEFKSHLKITSTTLLDLNIACGRITQRKINIDIIASNLSSIEYSSSGMSKFVLHTLNIKSHKLSKFSYRCTSISNLVEFSGLKNVTTIVLDSLNDGDVITHLFSECLQLEDVTIDKCRFTCGFKIVSAKLRHLSIVRCYQEKLEFFKMDIHALNLSSFVFRCFAWMRSMISLEAPKLLKVFWDAGFNKININNFAMHHPPENFAMHMSLSVMSKLMKDLVQSQKLVQVELFFAGAFSPNMDYFWILDIAMASQHLQKLSLTIRNGDTEIPRING